MHSVLLLQHLSPFYGSFNKGAYAYFSFFVPTNSGYSRSPQAQRNPAKNIGSLLATLHFQAFPVKLLRKLRSAFNSHDFMAISNKKVD